MRCQSKNFIVLLNYKSLHLPLNTYNKLKTIFKIISSNDTVNSNARLVLKRYKKAWYAIKQMLKLRNKTKQPYKPVVLSLDLILNSS